MEDDSRRNPSSDTTNVAQVCTLAIRVTLGSSDRNVPHEHTRRKETQKYLRKSCYYRIKCIATTFLTTFMWRRLLNNAALATTTHRRLKGMSDGTGTQVGT